MGAHGMLEVWYDIIMRRLSLLGQIILQGLVQCAAGCTEGGLVVLLLVGVAVAVIALYISSFFHHKPAAGCLDPKKFKEFKLLKKTHLNHNTSRFRFQLPTPTSVLGLPIGHHVLCRGKDEQGVEVIRPYTPITLDSDVGFFELVVKMYPKGRMSHHFREMRQGDNLPVRGPTGRFRYKPGQVGAFGMLAGGTGITPMFQLIRAILENPQDKTMVRLLYSNVTFQDILLKAELDGFASKFPEQLKVYYVLSKPPLDRNGGIGHITMDMIQKYCPPPANDVKILRCGPPGMNNAMAAHLNQLNYTPSMQFQF